MRKNLIGLIGLFLTALVCVLSLTVEMLSPNLAFLLLATSATVVLLGIFAGMKGSRWWFLEAAVGLLLAAFVLFGLVGP